MTVDKGFQFIVYENSEILEFFKKSRLFGCFPEETLKKLIPLSNFAKYSKGTTILAEGQQNDRIFFLMKGSVEILVEGDTILQLKRTGDIFGEMSIIDGKPCLASVVASSKDTEVFSIAASHVGAYTDMQPIEMQNFLYRIFAKILTEKLNLTTYKAKQFERTNRELQKTKSILQHDIAKRQRVEANLRIAKQQAEMANIAKSEFLSNISHELRTPMHHILNYSQLGIRKFNSISKDKIKHYFSQIRKTGERLMVLLNDLLDLSKLESGKMDYHMDVFSLYAIIDDLYQELNPLAAEKKITLNVDSPQIHTEVYCDDFRIRQVLLNLLSNAIKFTPEGKSIQISFQQETIIAEESPSQLLKVLIKDQGIGIPDNELNAVFDKFIQSTRTRTGAGGTGLGLAICNEIIKAHGGKIWVINNDEGGATFCFVLPQAQPII
jgi:signal transduction histidine kinase